MMSPDNIPAAKPPPATNTKDESQSSTGKKTAGSLRPPDQQQPLKCPRCDSPNTKFCYYNNYSLTQPRHFCKTCRRYWTKGGALRNVPIGGGCRKNKKIKSSSSSSSRLSGDSSKEYSSESSGGGLKFFHGLSPAMDFQLGGLSSFPKFNHPHPSPIYNNQFSSFGSTTSVIDPSGSSAGSLMMGFNYNPLSSSSVLMKQGENINGFVGGGGEIHQEMGSMIVHSNLASSIESLSSINQDLHWKLQQQRLAMLFGTGGGGDGDGDNNINNNQKDSSSNINVSPIETSHNNKPLLQPILFQNLEISRPEVCGGGGNSLRKDSTGATATEWFFDNSTAYAPVNATHSTNSSSNGGGNDNTSNWNGIQAWSTADLHQYSALP